MAWQVGMPSLGHTMETGTVTEWLKAVGDPVASGEVIATLETDKSSFDLEAPAGGILLALHVAEGVEVPVGTLLTEIGTAEEVAAKPAFGEPDPGTTARRIPVCGTGIGWANACTASACRLRIDPGQSRAAP